MSEARNGFKAPNATVVNSLVEQCGLGISDMPQGFTGFFAKVGDRVQVEFVSIQFPLGYVDTLLLVQKDDGECQVYAASILGSDIKLDTGVSLEGPVRDLPDVTFPKQHLLLHKHFHIFRHKESSRIFSAADVQTAVGLMYAEDNYDVIFDSKNWEMLPDDKQVDGQYWFNAPVNTFGEVAEYFRLDNRGIPQALDEYHED